MSNGTNNISLKWDGILLDVQGRTAFGIYDTDSQFIEDAKKFAKYCAYKFGYPILDVELNCEHFYSAYEEACLEYSYQVNAFNVRQNILSFEEIKDNTIKLNNVSVNSVLSKIIEISKNYALEANLSDKIKIKKIKFTTIPDKQDYDLSNILENENLQNKGKKIEIIKVYHNLPPASARAFLNFIGLNNISLTSVNLENYRFLMMPTQYDILRMNAIELSDYLIRSFYGFEIIGNIIKIFPIPKQSFDIYVDYIFVDEKVKSYLDVDITENLKRKFHNFNIENLKYSDINAVGKQWIKKYAFAICKVILGNIRSKFHSVPGMGGEITLDGDTLRSEGIQEKEQLLQELKELLEKTLRHNQIEEAKNEANSTIEILSKIPLPIIIS